MEITLQTDGKRICVDMEQGRCEKMFQRLASQLIGEARPGAPDVPEDTHEKSYEWIEDEKIHKYQGFLYLRCPECGKVKAFCSKKELRGYHCFECGADTPFTDELKKMYLNCQCGQRSVYWTNITDPMLDVNCPKCGNPVAVSWNEKKGIYQPITG